LAVDTSAGVVLLAALTTVIGGVCLAITIQGWCFRKINIVERIAFATVVWLLNKTLTGRKP